jgi:hypothetical protein
MLPKDGCSIIVQLFPAILATLHCKKTEQWLQTGERAKNCDQPNKNAK